MKIVNKSELENELRHRLHDATKVAVIGVGYELGSDDGAGLAVARNIQLKLPDVPVYLGGSAPENYTGPVVKAKPSHVIFIDAAVLESQPGDVAVIDKDEIKGARFSTHTLPLGIIMDYFEMSSGAKSFAIGIQPFSEGFGDQISPEIVASVDTVSEALVKVIDEVTKKQ